MAGTIVISENACLATSTQEFDYLVERIRGAFVPEDRQVLSEIFEPVDEGGMTYISVSEQGSAGLKSFGNAVKRAYSMSEREKSFARHKDRWIELMELIRADSRWVATE